MRSYAGDISTALGVESHESHPRPLSIAVFASGKVSPIEEFYKSTTRR